MGFFGKLVVFVYAVFFIVLGALFVGLALALISPREILSISQGMVTDPQQRLVTGLVGVVLIMVSFWQVNGVFSGRRRERTITFDTTAGQVKMSLAALEDFVQRSVTGFSGIKDLRATIVPAPKRGMTLNARVVVYSDANVSEVSERLQSMITAQIRTMLGGVGNQVAVEVYIAKVAMREAARAPRTARAQTQPHTIQPDPVVEFDEDQIEDDTQRRDTR